jgi:hypothetical protein
MNISKRQLKKFQILIDKYKKDTEFPVRYNWQDKSNNELWLWLVGQVMVVGGIAGNDRFQGRRDLKKKLNYSSLSRLTDDNKMQIAINEVLRDAGVRYASSDLGKCHKSKALVHNYKFISNYKGGLKGLLKHVSHFKGNNVELDRVSFLTHHFKFIKNKSARDFLMSMGINTNTLALDIRIKNIFKHFDIDFPTQAELARKPVYDKTEIEIIEKICKPLNIKPVKFDRILFQHYDQIVGKKLPQHHKNLQSRAGNKTSK